MPTILGAVALSATAYYLSIGLGPFWPAVWIAPIPVLVVAARRRARTAALIAFAASFAGSLNLLTFLARVLPLPIVIVMLALTSLVCVTAVLSARLAMQVLNWGLLPNRFRNPPSALPRRHIGVSGHATGRALTYPANGARISVSSTDFRAIADCTRIPERDACAVITP